MGVSVSQVSFIKLFLVRRKNCFYLPLWHKSFILDDVKPAELSNNSFESKNVTFYGLKTYSDHSYIFSRGQDRPNPQNLPVMWSETVGLRTRPVWVQKNRSWSWSCSSAVSVLVLQYWCCFCETRSCNARRHNDLEGHSNFSSTIFSLFCAWTSLLWRSAMAFTYLKVKYAKCLCLLPVLVLVLVLLLWSWS